MPNHSSNEIAKSQRQNHSFNGNKRSYNAKRIMKKVFSMLQRERFSRRYSSRSYNGNLHRKPNKQKKPAPEITPGRALLCLRKPKSLEYQGFKAKRKCTVILSKLPCIGGGDEEIRTLEELMTPTRFPIVRARPTTRHLRIAQVTMYQLVSLHIIMHGSHKVKEYFVLLREK